MLLLLVHFYESSIRLLREKGYFHFHQDNLSLNFISYSRCSEMDISQKFSTSSCVFSTVFPLSFVTIVFCYPFHDDFSPMHLLAWLLALSDDFSRFVELTAREENISLVDLLEDFRTTGKFLLSMTVTRVISFKFFVNSRGKEIFLKRRICLVRIWDYNT